MNGMMDRRDWLAICGGSVAASLHRGSVAAAEPVAGTTAPRESDLVITEMTVTPIALPDPPILAASGCHGPYFLRNVVQLKTADGITGIAEANGGASQTERLQRMSDDVVGMSALHWRSLREKTRSNSAYAALELACLDAVGRAKNLRLCDLLGGAVRDEVEFASYLFFRYAADHPVVLDDDRIADDRGRGDAALDAWGEVRSPESMAEMAWKFHQKWGFRVHKLKAGVLDPSTELATLEAMNDRFDETHRFRIDPNGRWTIPTADAIGKQIVRQRLPLEYYEDPVDGQPAMAAVRKETPLKMATNMCVTRFDHIRDAVQTEPIDVVLADYYGWGGITACHALGTLAPRLGWGIGQHSSSHAGVTMAAMIHLGATVADMTYPSDTHYVWLPDNADIIRGPKLVIRGGKMQVPRDAGVGVELDLDQLARAHEVYSKCGMRGRDDATLMRRIVPGWTRNRL